MDGNCQRWCGKHHEETKSTSIGSSFGGSEQEPQKKLGHRMYITGSNNGIKTNKQTNNTTLASRCFWVSERQRKPQTAVSNECMLFCSHEYTSPQQQKQSTKTQKECRNQSEQ